MSEEQDNTLEETPEAEAQAPRGGERLADARRQQQISVLEVAKELHLDEPKVRALERNDFDVLGAPVFAKGHLKKYAQLVHVDSDDVLADYYQLTRQETVPPVVVGRDRVRRDFSPGPWIAAIIFILVIAASYWWFAVSSNEVTPPAAVSEDMPPAEQQDLTETASEITDPASVNASEPQFAVDEPEVLPSQPEQDAGASTPADNEVRLSLAFSGDCWTEVSDATGRRLFFDMGRNGNSVELAGVAPFSVLLGNVDNVSVRVDGEDYPVSTTNPGGRTARLTIMTP